MYLCENVELFHGVQNNPNLPLLLPQPHRLISSTGGPVDQILKPLRQLRFGTQASLPWQRPRRFELALLSGQKLSDCSFDFAAFRVGSGFAATAGDRCGTGRRMGRLVQI